MIRTLLTLRVAGFLLASATLVNPADAAIEINPSVRTFYAQVAGVGDADQVTIPSLRTDSPLNWTNTSPALSWNASGDASQTIVYIAPPSTEVSTSNNDISLYVNNSSQLVLSIDSTHSRTAGAIQAGYFGNGVEGIYFTLDQDTPFWFSGDYAVTSSSGFGSSQFQSSLTSGFTSYFNYSQSGFGSLNYSESTSGVLPAGTYQWYMHSRIVAGGGGTSSSNAEGNFTLILGEAADPGTPNVAPEAASLITWGGILLGAGLTLCRRHAPSLLIH